MRLRTFSAVLSFIAMANKNKELFVPISGTDRTTWRYLCNPNEK
jgi:hypothetical protein